LKLNSITEHLVDNNKCIAIIVNYMPENVNDSIKIKKGWRLKKTYYGKAKSDNQHLKIEVLKNDALVIELIREKQDN
jgi:hypothetical protein